MKHEDNYREFTDEQITEMFINETRFQRGYDVIPQKKNILDKEPEWIYIKGIKTYKK
jgi:hypothetical protein